MRPLSKNWGKTPSGGRAEPPDIEKGRGVVTAALSFSGRKYPGGAGAEPPLNCLQASALASPWAA